jgi:hypothetical protein
MTTKFICSASITSCLVVRGAQLGCLCALTKHQLVFGSVNTESVDCICGCTIHVFGCLYLLVLASRDAMS